MFIFQHLPRTAGSFVTDILRTSVTSSKLFECKRDFEVWTALSDKTICTRAISAHLSSRLIRRLLLDRPVITCLREPVDRVISQFFYWREHFQETISLDSTSRYRLTVDPDADPWQDLLRCLEDDALPNYMELRDLQANQLADHPLDRKLSQSEVFDLALDWCSRAAVIGTTEQMGDFLQRLSSFIDVAIPKRSEEGRTNFTMTRPGREQVPAEVRAAIERRNCVDIALYNEVNGLIQRTIGSIKSSRLASIQDKGMINPAVLARQQHSNAIHPSTFWNLPAFEVIPGWMSRDRMILFYSLCSIQRNALNGHVVEFRPEYGQQLAAIAAISQSGGPILGAGFEDDKRIYPSHLGSSERCRIFLQDFLPAGDIYLMPTVQDGMDWLVRNHGTVIRIGIVSRPFNSNDVSGQLRFLEKQLAEDGFVWVDGVYNQDWPHVGEGLFRYLSLPGRELSPAVIACGGVVLIRKKQAYKFIDLLQAVDEYQDRKKFCVFFGDQVMQLLDSP